MLFVLLGSSTAFGQDRFAIYYKFKPQDTYTLAQPQAYLSAAALERRAKEAVVVDSLDLPVSERYIREVEPLTEYILYHSKWFNASIAVLTEEAVRAISELPYVDRIEYIAPGFAVRPNARIKGRLFASVTLATCSNETKRMLATNEMPYDFQNELLGIPLMHEEGFRGASVKIAVFDAGFPGVNTMPSLSHLFSNEQLLASTDVVRPWMPDVFGDNQHGTNVLSLIASDDPELLLAGAPDADYVLVITEDDNSEYRIEEYNWVRGAEFADSVGVDIIQSSVGYWDFDDPTMNYAIADMDGETAIITRGAQTASDKGILVVNSSGNYGSGESTLVAPADARGVLSIGAVNSNLETSSFSSRGPTGDGRLKPDLTTFGSGVSLLRSNGSLGFANGTSFSAPQITALAAGLMQARPDWSKEQLRENLLRSGTQAENPDNLQGYGIPNFYRAFYGEILSVEEPGELPVWKVYPNPVLTDKLSILIGNELSTTIRILDMSGREVISQSLSRASVREPYLLNIFSIKPGLYILEAMDGRQVRQTKLFRK